MQNYDKSRKLLILPRNHKTAIKNVYEKFIIKEMKKPYFKVGLYN